MAIFEKAYDPVRQWEGGWCNVEGDRGGETYAGIARNFWPGWPGWKTIDGAKQHTSFRSGARAFSRHLDGIPGLRDMVEDWYRTEWWDRMSLGTLPQTLADELFEQAVNLGRGGAVRSLQRLCNALNYDKSGKRTLFPPWPTFSRNAAPPKIWCIGSIACKGRITWPLPRKTRATGSFWMAGAPEPTAPGTMR